MKLRLITLTPALTLALAALTLLPSVTPAGAQTCTEPGYVIQTKTSFRADSKCGFTWFPNPSSAYVDCYLQQNTLLQRSYTNAAAGNDDDPTWTGVYWVFHSPGDYTNFYSSSQSLSVEERYDGTLNCVFTNILSGSWINDQFLRDTRTNSWDVPDDQCQGFSTSYQYGYGHFSGGIQQVPINGLPEWRWVSSEASYNETAWISRGGCGPNGPETNTISTTVTNTIDLSTTAAENVGARTSTHCEFGQAPSEFKRIDVSMPYTDGQLWTNLMEDLPSYSGWLDENYAAWTRIERGHWDGRVSPVIYRLGLPAQTDPLQPYQISWDEIVVYLPEGDSHIYQHRSATLIGTGDLTSTLWTTNYTLAPPFHGGDDLGLVILFVANVQVTRAAIAADPGTGGFHTSANSACPTCATPAAIPSAGITAAFSLGMASPRHSAGSLSFWVPTPSTTLATPAALHVDNADPTDEIVSLNGTLRQIKCAQAVVDVVTNNDFAYDLRFYLPSQITNYNGQLYQLSGDPFVTWRVQSPDASTNTFNRLRLTETRGSDVKTSDAVFTTTTGTWVVSAPAGTYEEEILATIDGQQQTREILVTVRKPGGSDVLKTKRTYQQIQEGDVWHDRLVGETLDPDGSPKATTWEYYPYASSRRGPLVKKIIRPDGSWEWFTYDLSQRRSAVYTPIGNAAPEGNQTPTTPARETQYHYGDEAGTYLPDSGDDGSLVPDLPRCVIHLLPGEEISREYTVVPSAEFRIHVQAATRYAAWNDPANLFTTNRYFTSGPNQYRLKSIVNPDGTFQTFDYAQDASGTFITNMTASGQPDATFTRVIDGTTNWTVLNIAGQPVFSASKDIATASIVAQSAYADFNAFGRPGRVNYLDGTSENTQHGCCGIETTTDRDGVLTQYKYDAAKRQTAQTTLGITFTNVLDAAGRVLQRLRIGSNGPPVTLSQFQYSPAGQLLKETNALNGVTTYSETTEAQTGERSRTTTYPDGGTRIETYYREGALKSLTGTAVQPLRYEYGFEDSGPDSGCQFTLEVRLKEDGTDSSEWTMSSTDALGRNYKTVYADDTSEDLSDNPCSRSFYNGKGQLWKQVDPDGVTTLFTYNSKGEQEYQIVAVQPATAGLANYSALLAEIPTLKSGTDRITRTTNDLASAHGTTVRRSRTYVWDVLNSSASSLVSMSESTLDGLQSWQTTYRAADTPVVSHSQTVYATGGWRYVTNTAPDLSYTVSAHLNGRLVSATRRDSLNTQLSALNYSYDSNGRQTALTDARNGTTSYTYNNADLVESVTTPNPGTIGGSAQVTTTFYDKALRATNIIQPDLTSMRTDYYPNGLVKLNYGSRTYPVGYSYDYAGRIESMTNWTDFSSGAGARVTTWNYNQYRGWLENKRYPDDRGPSYTYKPSGRLQTRTWARGVTTTYDYTTSGELATIDYSDTTPDVTFTFDRMGRQATIIQNGITTSLAYNLAGEQISETYSGGTLGGLSLTNGYDPLLRRTNLVARNSTTALLQHAFAYDGASRLQKVTDYSTGTPYSAWYNYVANSPLVSQILFTNNGVGRMTTTKQWDFLNRLTSISSAASASSSFSSFAYVYNQANQRGRRTEADGSYWRYEYDALGQVKSGKKYWADGTPVAGQQFEYVFDEIGNRTQTKAGGDQNGWNLRSANYGANALNQYTNRDVPGYIEVTGVAFATNPVTVNTQTTYRKGEYFRKELSPDNGSVSVWQSVSAAAAGETTVNGNVFLPKTQELFGYDLDGNLTTDGRWNYTWDAENRLITMAANTLVGPQLSLRFEYDSKSRRIRKQVWPNTTWNGASTNDLRFVYDSWNQIATLNSALSSINCFMWGLDLSGSMQGAGGVGGLLAVNDVTQGVHFVAFDGNGNVATLVKAGDGTGAATYECSPFGEVIRATGPMAKANPFRFSTKYQDDETDLLYYGYRYFSASTGRWASRDPIGERSPSNLYCFSANASISRVDLFGLLILPPSYKFNFDSINTLLESSKEDFRNKLYRLCPARSTRSCEGSQVCERSACLVQADLLTADFASYLRATFATQFVKFGNILAFTPMWNLLIENINDRANNASMNGMKWTDYSEGYGLKCEGMQSLMSRRFTAVIAPFQRAGLQCFKGAELGNDPNVLKASHKWFGIYRITNPDIRHVDVLVDPWFSAGGIISPSYHVSGEEKYWTPVLWW